MSTARKRVWGLLSCALVFCLLALRSSRAESYAPVVREASFAAGGLVILDVNVGDVRVEPAETDGKVRLVITSHRQDDADAAPNWVREFAINGSQAKIKLQTPKRGTHGFEVTIYVPRRTDLRVSLGVGDLTIEGVTGNTDADLWIGDLKMTVADPHAYHAVAMSVHIGDVNAKAFGLEPSGFLGKSVQRDYNAGSYRLKLHTGIGDVSCISGSGA